MRTLIHVLIVVILFCGVVVAQPREDNYTMTKQARLALIATWVSVSVGFLTVILTIKRDRSARQRSAADLDAILDARVRKIVHEELNDPAQRARFDQRVIEVGRSLAYQEFRYDPRHEDRMRQMENELSELRSAVRDMLRRNAE